MQVWSVGVSEKALVTSPVRKFSNATIRYFNNGLELVTALRRHTPGRLAILLNIRLPVLDGLGVIRLLQQEGLIHQHDFILSAPGLPDADREQLKAWNVSVVHDHFPLRTSVTDPINCKICG